MRPVFRAAGILVIFLLVPLVPFLILGESFEKDVRDWVQADQSRAHQLEVLLVLGVLAADIFLPIPSSAVMTGAGGIMPFWSAVLASWIGLTVGAIAGFGLARYFGPPFARRFSAREDLTRIAAVGMRYGPTALLLTRPLPILAEACVLLMGTTQLSWSRFLPPVLASNLGLAIFYVACGAGIEDQKMLTLAAVGSGTLPLLLALFIRHRLSAMRSVVTDGDITLED